MRIEINGKKEDLDKDTLSVSELLVLNKVDRPEMVSVQLNGKFINKDDLEKTFISDGDEVDFLYFMGGGK